MDWMEWYNSLEKPSWTPEPATIGLVWQCLYPVILITFGFIFVQGIRKKLPWHVVLPFGVNLIANLIFSPIQFSLRNNPLASIDILIIWGSLIWLMIVVWKHHKWVALAQIPYFIWVSIATVLQLLITRSNWGH